MSSTNASSSSNGSGTNNLKNTGASKSSSSNGNAIRIGLYVLLGILIVYVTLAEFNEWWPMHTKRSRRVAIWTIVGTFSLVMLTVVAIFGYAIFRPM